MVVAAIFDLDGTLVTFKFDVKGTRRAIIGLFESQGIDTTGLGLNTPTQEMLDTAKARLPPGDKRAYDALRAKVFSVLDDFEEQSVPSTSVFPGTREILLGLKTSRVRLAVLTNSGRKSALQSLGRAGLLDLFEFVLTRNETEVMKPRPEGVMMAVGRLSVPKVSVYYVGDSLFDIMAAKGAGVKVVSVATGNYSADRLKDDGADFVIHGLSDLSSVLEPGT
jgi:phosphoglycolate phosphatase-like HAD superfamily hydrolase